MNEVPRQKLGEIITEYGRGVCDDPKRCEALLNDLCPGHRRENRILVVALREGIVADLDSSKSQVPLAVLLERLAKKLHDNHGIAEHFAAWAVESWSLALGFSVPQEATKLNFRCPLCGASGKAPAKYAGTVVQCPKCVRRIRISPDGLTFTPEASAARSDVSGSRLVINDPDPEQAELLKERAILETKSHRFESAIKTIEESIRLNSACSLGEGYEEIRAELYDLIGDKKPKQAWQMYNRAVDAAARSRFAVAVSAYEEAIELDPDSPWPCNNLAWILATARDAAVHDGIKAVQYANRACRLTNWSSWTFLDTLAAAYARAGDFSKATEICEVTLRLVPEDHKTFTRLRLRQFKKGEAYVDEEDSVAAGDGSDKENERHRNPNQSNHASSDRYLSSEGFQRARWGMDHADVATLYPDGESDQDGDLTVVKKVAGEDASICLIFHEDALWRVLTYQGYGLDGDSAVDRFMNLYQVLRSRYGEPVSQQNNWHVNSKYDPNDRKIWGMAVAASQLRMFAGWKTEETSIILSCAREEEFVCTRQDFTSNRIRAEISENTARAKPSAVEVRVIEIVAELMGVGTDQLSRETAFVDDLGADSLDAVELVTEFEEEYGITIPNEDTERIVTIGEAIHYIEKLLE